MCSINMHLIHPHMVFSIYFLGVLCLKSLLFPGEPWFISMSMCLSYKKSTLWLMPLSLVANHKKGVHSCRRMTSYERCTGQSITQGNRQALSMSSLRTQHGAQHGSNKTHQSLLWDQVITLLLVHCVVLGKSISFLGNCLLFCNTAVGFCQSSSVQASILVQCK